MKCGGSDHKDHGRSEYGLPYGSRLYRVLVIQCFGDSWRGVLLWEEGEGDNKGRSQCLGSLKLASREKLLKERFLQIRHPVGYRQRGPRV